MFQFKVGRSCAAGKFLAWHPDNGWWLATSFQFFPPTLIFLHHLKESHSTKTLLLTHRIIQLISLICTTNCSIIFINTTFHIENILYHCQMLIPKYHSFLLEFIRWCIIFVLLSFQSFGKIWGWHLDNGWWLPPEFFPPTEIAEKWKEEEMRKGGKVDTSTISVTEQTICFVWGKAPLSWDEVV